MDQGLHILQNKFNELAENGDECSLLHWLKYWSMDNSSLLIFGESFGCVKNDADVNGILGLTRASTSYASVVGIYPEWHSFLWRYMPDSIMREKEVRAFCEKQISDKEAASEDDRGACFLDTWFQQKESEKMDRTEVRIGIGGALGGTELTPSFMAQAIYHVYRDPALLQRARDEIDHAVANSKTESAGFLSHEAIQDMPYLNSILKETLRLYPVIAITLPRVVPEGGALLAGHQFRAGQVVGVNASMGTRNSEYFGPNPTKFCPERWLGDSDEAKRVAHYAVPVRAPCGNLLRGGSHEDYSSVWGVENALESMLQH